MRNTINLKYIGYTTGLRKNNEKYYCAKFIDDEEIKLLAFIIDDKELLNKIFNLDRYTDCVCDVDFVRNKYGNYEMQLIDLTSL